MRKETKEKYYQFMLDLYNSNEFDMRMMIKKHQVSTRIASLLRDRRMVVKYGKLYKWIGDLPTTTMAIYYGKESLKIARVSKLHNQHSEKQLTIASIRKAPAPTPLPIAKEPEYDNSNSKMLLILAVGAIVGFLVATLIWK